MNTTPAEQWFAARGWDVFPFQKEAWQHFGEGTHGLVNAPTGSGKTYSLMVPILLSLPSSKPGLKAIWITPIRALAKEILQSAERAAQGMGIQARIAIRTGDSTTKEKTQLRKTPPDILITTPETLHVLLAQKGYPDLFKNYNATQPILES